MTHTEVVKTKDDVSAQLGLNLSVVEDGVGVVNKKQVINSDSQSYSRSMQILMVC